MTRFEALISLNMVSDIGSIRLQKLLDCFGAPENIFKASQDNLIAVSAISRETADQIRSFKKEDLVKELALAKKHGLQILTFEDDDYPLNLKNIAGSPIVLYVKGRILKEDLLSIAIVGSRRASYYGLSHAEKFARDLTASGFSVISGMARGIDTCAHNGALDAGGRTIAVMGSGFNHIYPAENLKLCERIAQNGAVISEFPINSGPTRKSFPRRNRIISGLSQGVLIVEAARNSGALITADFALEQGREVFALPGKIDSANYFGTNELIKQGAKLVSCVEDILEEFPFSLKSKSAEELKTAETDDLLIGQSQSLSCAETQLCNIITRQPLSMDEIVEKTNSSISGLAGVLLKLQLKKLIRQLPGRQFIKI